MNLKPYKTTLGWLVLGLVVGMLLAQAMFSWGYGKGQLNYAQGLITYTVVDGRKIHILGKVKE